MLLFCDNDGSGHAVVRGYSPSLQTAVLVNEVTEAVALLCAFMFVECVPSCANVVEAPWRLRTCAELAGSEGIAPAQPWR